LDRRRRRRSKEKEEKCDGGITHFSLSLSVSFHFVFRVVADTLTDAKTHAHNRLVKVYIYKNKWQLS